MENQLEIQWTIQNYLDPPQFEDLKTEITFGPGVPKLRDIDYSILALHCFSEKEAKLQYNVKVGGPTQVRGCWWAAGDPAL